MVGRSGCGKTTLLRVIAGFVGVDHGSIEIDGVVVSGPHFTAPPEKRGVGLVFQDYALFPHLTVAANIAFGLRHLGSAARAARVDEMVNLVGLAAFARRYPHELSGGQQQRVALARALAPRPALLLMDEPFSSLDVDLRQRLGAEVRGILKSSGTTAVLVTHDQQEAFAIADRVGVMHSGRLEQWDRRYELYHRPATRYVADFIGQGVFLPARVLSSMNVEIELGELRSSMPVPCRHGAAVVTKGCQHRSPAAAGRRDPRRCKPAQGGGGAPGFPRRRLRLHAVSWTAGAKCWRWCRATTITRSAKGSASGSTPITL